MQPLSLSVIDCPHVWAEKVQVGVQEMEFDAHPTAHGMKVFQKVVNNFPVV